MLESYYPLYGSLFNWSSFYLWIFLIDSLWDIASHKCPKFEMSLSGGSLSRGSLSRGLCLGVSLPKGVPVLGFTVQGVSVWESLSRGLCPGVSFQGGFCLGCLCPGGLCLGVSVQRSLSRGFSFQGDLCLGVSVQGGLCSGGERFYHVMFCFPL